MNTSILNTKDLMVGDWVKPKNVDASFRVGLIGADSVWNDTDTHEWYYDELEPIPLTAETLEKNGIKWFCTEPSGRKTYCCNEPVVQCTYIPNSGWLINVGACGSIKVRFVEISKIQYVHELQHALRLCGTSKEIEL